MLRCTFWKLEFTELIILWKVRIAVYIQDLASCEFERIKDLLEQEKSLRLGALF